MANYSPFGQPEFRNLRSWALGRITDDIIHGELTPGSRINETELAAQFGLSRSPIREALRQLERDGLVVTLPNSSTYVTSLSYEEFEQLYEIRAALEPLMLQYAVKNATDTEVDELVQPIIQMRESLESCNPGALVDLDVAFHLKLYAFGRRDKLCSILNVILQQSRRYMLITTREQVYEGWSACVTEHLAIYNAIKKRNPAEAQAALSTHLSHGSARMLKQLSSYTATTERG